MRKPLLLAAACILAFPLMFSFTQTQSIESKGRSPFAAVALAGHTVHGTWCECGSSAACACDPGETPNGQTVSRDTQDRNESPTGPTQDEGIDFGAVALMLVFFALTLSRLRG